MSDAPTVSIGMPVYNGEATIAAAIDALRAQSYSDFEVVINDNASTDATEAICRRYAGCDPRIRYERNTENLGAAGNFNRVLARARGRYFKWFACDDLLESPYLERCVAALEEGGPDAVLAFPDRGILAHTGERLRRDPYLVTGSPGDERTYDDIGFPRLMRVCGSRCPIFVFGLMRTDAVRRTRGMGNFVAADLVFVAEMRLLGRFRRVPETLFWQRLHAPTPEVFARTRNVGDAAWFDPRRRARFPELKLLVEMVRAVRRAPQPTLERWRCYVGLGGHVATRAHRWSVLGARRFKSRMWRIWSHQSVLALSAARVTTLPLRLWALAAGLRHADGRTCKLAVTGPWWRTNPKLLRFGATRISRRDESGGARLFTTWLIAGDGDRKQIAADVLADRATRDARVVASTLTAQQVNIDTFVERMQSFGGAASAEAWKCALAKRTPLERLEAAPPNLCQAAG